MNFTDKKVWVTGASRGIGRAIAIAFAKQGARVLATATEKDNLQCLLDKSRENGWSVEAASMHFGQSNWLESIEELCQDRPTPDILINNAGITSDGIFMRQSADVFSQALQVNLQGGVELTRRVIRSMMKAKFGRVINISSVVATTGNAGQAYYCSVKAGIEGFTRALAREIGSRGITVNAIAPGLIQTAMTDKLTNEQKERAMQEIPLGRVGRPEDVAMAALFLASDQASYITGQTIHVNGGMCMN